MTATTAAPTTDRRAFALRMIRDIGVPTGAYYVLHGFGASDLVALGAGTVVSGAILLTDTVRARKFDLFAGVMLGVFGIGLLLTFLSGDARFMIAKDSIGTGLVGSAFLISAAIGKPLTYVAALRGMTASDPAKAAAFEERYRSRPGMRQSFRRLTVLWGAGLLAEAVVRCVLAYQLPIATMVWLSTVLMIATMGGLTGLTVVLVKKWRAAAERADAAA